MLAIPAEFVIDKLATSKLKIAHDIYNHNVAINYRVLCKQRLSNNEINKLFITKFLLTDCNFNYLLEEQKLIFLTNIQ
jgi:hypothetical protein